jgi:uncharacterized pyridoxamine 5'-phosphate oxidase family protein
MLMNWHYICTHNTIYTQQCSWINIAQCTHNNNKTHELVVGTAQSTHNINFGKVWKWTPNFYIYNDSKTNGHIKILKLGSLKHEWWALKLEKFSNK